MRDLRLSDHRSGESHSPGVSRSFRNRITENLRGHLSVQPGDRKDQGSSREHNSSWVQGKAAKLSSKKRWRKPRVEAGSKQDQQFWSLWNQESRCYRAASETHQDGRSRESEVRFHLEDESSTIQLSSAGTQASYSALYNPSYAGFWHIKNCLYFAGGFLSPHSVKYFKYINQSGQTRDLAPMPTAKHKFPVTYWSS